MPSSPRPPEFLLDRGLDRVVVPEALRAEGAVVRTLAAVYGDQEQFVSGEEWLERAGMET